MKKVAKVMPQEKGSNLLSFTRSFQTWSCGKPIMKNDLLQREDCLFLCGSKKGKVIMDIKALSEFMSA